jgi:hypothetical protein
MTRQELQRMRAWADDKIAANQEPQWAWYQLMKLRESLDAIVGQMEAESIASEMAAYLPVAEEVEVERGPRLVVSNSAADVAPVLSGDDIGVLGSIKQAGSR